MTEDFVDWVPTMTPSSPPPSETISWVQAELGAVVVGIEELVGGLSSAVHRLVLDGRPNVVLRRFTLADWLELEPNVPHDEAHILALLDEVDIGVSTPTLLAADPDARHCDVPAIVMTEVAGRPIIEPNEPFVWAERQAECLARIHDHRPIASLPRYRRWDDPGRPVPTWTADADLWRHAIDVANVSLPAHPDVFMHRDFHPCNLHWVDGELVGVVDWLSACTGPIAGDLAHNRWNLAVLADIAVAEHFTEHYRSVTGYGEDVLLFDLATVLSGPVGPFPTHAWNALGREDLTSETVAPRIDAWLHHLLG